MPDINNNYGKEDRLTMRLASLLCVVGCVLLIAGFVVDPKGQIHSSVLVAFAEIMTFVGALLGISARFKSVIKELINNKHNPNDSNK